MDQTLMSTGTAAVLLGVSRQHVVDLCERGELPFTRVGKHRRISPRDIENLTNPLTPDEQRSLWLHEVVLGQLILDPERVIRIARQNLHRWQGLHRSDGMSVHYLNQWEAILDRGIDDVRRALVGIDRQSIELRQNSPFAGVLTEKQRAKVLRNFAAHRAEPHGLLIA
ncbi:DNA-binding protein [Mycetocola tolaasinivorans]|uniref:DNA-binding protein n=1 Tax=Mycetocola tolaasinivorans TaxID=76635 RepID=A0A3L7A1D8_9MICO|nr:helix-turn-helix domain-containing protein [Mycetocola tolaasinivorans]RLP74103.1 DNA-binding protein [Mycetocola tolaasinivorans]